MRFHLGCTMFGVEVGQWWDDLALLELAMHRSGGFGAIVELGTFRGGLSLFLALHAEQSGAVFATFDNEPAWLAETPLTDRYVRGAVNIIDVFTPDGQRMVHAVLALSGDRPALLVCDNGDKRREVATFAPMLRQKDWLAVHDVGTEIFLTEIPDSYVPVLDEERSEIHAYGGTVAGHLRLFVHR